jgi:hypothetical protein
MFPNATVGISSHIGGPGPAYIYRTVLYSDTL